MNDVVERSVSESFRSRVAFQGEPGAFSEEAAIGMLGDQIELVPCRTFPDLFASVSSGRADYIVAPVENSLIGKIQPVIEQLQQYDYQVLDQRVLRIEQHVIGCAQVSLTEIDCVESHPAALAQCQKFFDDHPAITRMESLDTAGSVARIVQEGNCRHAAIAGRRAAELYGGSVIQESVQDSPENFTTFVLLR